MTSPSTITYKLVTYEEQGDALIDVVGDMMCKLMDELGEEWVEADMRSTVEMSIKHSPMEIYCAFNGQGRCIGGLGLYIIPELWNYGTLTANEAYWYVDPRYRGKVGGGLLDFVEKNTKADKIVFGISKPALAKYLGRLGYEHQKVLLEKWL
ncbi:MAG: GNAT family N-acetyltransferase [Pseudomonadales bacterium]|nr:GNAT family N-acetyltransferase [Pseudomonadales bacterium]